jgi:hypothetical protein
MGMISLVFVYATQAAPCDIYIHGHSLNPDYFDDKPHVVNWDHTREVADVAEDVAEKILVEMDHCDTLKANLRAHGQGANLSFYILAQGRRFSRVFPSHPFVKVFRKVEALYSYAGAFNGTPLMDQICAGGEAREEKAVLGNECLLSMTTSRIHRPVNQVVGAGVPVYLVYGDKGRINGRRSPHLDLDRLSAKQVEEGVINQSDGVIPQYSSIACDGPLVLEDGASNCEKINRDDFVDFLYAPGKNYFDLVKDEVLLKQVYRNNKEVGDE